MEGGERMARLCSLCQGGLKEAKEASLPTPFIFLPSSGQGEIHPPHPSLRPPLPPPPPTSSTSSRALVTKYEVCSHPRELRCVQMPAAPHPAASWAVWHCPPLVFGDCRHLEHTHTHTQNESVITTSLIFLTHSLPPAFSALSP